MEPLKTSFRFAENGSPLVVVHNLPGLDAELTTSQLRELIAALTHAADLAEVSVEFCNRMQDPEFVAKLQGFMQMMNGVRA